MQTQPVVFLIVFQLGLRDLGVGILPLLPGSIAPLRSDSKIVQFLSFAFVENQKGEKTQIYRKKYTTTFNISLSSSILERGTNPAAEFKHALPYSQTDSLA
jgi:hypothetical protein